MLIQKVFLMALFLLLLASQLFAQLEVLTTEDMLKMSIEELLEIKITTAGKRLENVSDIPASVVIVTQDEVQRYGYKDVSDILKHIIGLYCYDMGEGNNFGIRGYWNTRNNRNIVILINGIDFLNIYDDQNYSSSFNVPVESIERIEFVRGPMSVMYGNGAVFGTLNIITRYETQTEHNNLFVVLAGMENSSKLTLRSAGESGDFKYSFNSMMYHSDGRNFDFSTITDSIPRLDGTFTKDADTKELFSQNNVYLDFSGNFKSFYTGIVFSKSQFGFVLPSLPIENVRPKRLHDFYTINFGFRKELSPVFTFDVHFNINDNALKFTDFQTGREIPGQPLVIPDPIIGIQNTSSWLTEITTFIKPVERLDITLGYINRNVVAMEIFDHAPKFGKNRNKSYLDNPLITHAPYTKVSYWLTNKLLLDAGVRFEQRKTYDVVKEYVDPANLFHSEKETYGDDNWNLTHNIAALYKLNKSNNLKILFGKAINHPTPSELLDIFSTDLIPQEIHSFELNYNGFFFSKLAASFSVFHNQLDKLILMTFTEDQPLIKNFGKMETTGGELIITYRPETRFEVAGALSYQQTKDKSYEKEIDSANSPNWLANLKTSYKINNNISVAATAHYVSEMEAIWDFMTNSRAADNVDGYFDLGANIRIENIPVKNLFLNIRGTNLFDTEIYYANPIPGIWYENGFLGQGRLVQTSLGYKF